MQALLQIYYMRLSIRYIITGSGYMSTIRLLTTDFRVVPKKFFY